MSRKKFWFGLLALALVVCVAGGCWASDWFGAELEAGETGETPSPVSTAYDPQTPTPAPAPEPQAERGEEGERAVPTHFKDMAYARPDAQHIAGAAEAFTAKIPDAASAGALLEEYEALESMYADYNAMYVLAMLRASMGRSDEYWVNEERVLLEAYSALDKASGELMLALYDSPLREEIEADWDPHFFLYIDQAEYTTQATKPLFEREAALISDQKDQLAHLTIPYRGGALTYQQIYALEDYESWMQASELWYAAHSEGLIGRYIELIKVRRQIAQTLGFESYTAFALEEGRRGFTEDMVSALMDDIARELVPVMKRVQEYGRFWPDAQTELAPYMEFAREALEDMNPELAHTYDAMTELGLYDLTPRAYKEQGAFTVYIDKYDLPFLFGSFTGDLSSMNTFAHEFGHFYNSYITMEEPPSTLDEAEIHSQALELFMSGYYGNLFGFSLGYQMRYDTLYDAVQVFAGQAYYTDMELQLYALEEAELTVDRLSEIALATCERFGMNLYFDAYARYDWVTLPHIFEQPFYTLSYVTSQSVALELWELFMQDRRRALELYDALVRREYGVTFLDMLEKRGLKSPFARGRIGEIAALAQKYLLDEEWS